MIRQEAPPPINCPVGNPVDTSTGAKIQKETDIAARAIGQIGFDRTYNNSNKSKGGSWYNSYDKFLRVLNSDR